MYLPAFCLFKQFSARVGLFRLCACSSISIVFSYFSANASVVVIDSVGRIFICQRLRRHCLVHRLIVTSMPPPSSPIPWRGVSSSSSDSAYDRRGTQPIYQQHNHGKKSTRLKWGESVQTYARFFWQGSTGPSGSVSKHFQTTYVIPTQRQQATGFYVFLRQDTIQPMELNTDTIPRLSMVYIPSSSKVLLVLGVGFGLWIICAFPSTIANQYGMLSGEGGTDLGCLNVLTLPDLIH